MVVLRPTNLFEEFENYLLISSVWRFFGRATYFSGLFGDPCSVPDCGMGGWVECGEDLFSKGWWRQQCGGQPTQLAYDMPSVYTQYKATRGEEDGSAGL